MSSWIRIEPPRLRGSRLENRIATSPDLDGFFNTKNFYVDYDEKIQASPGILNIPAVSSLITLAWLTGAELEVAEIDTTFSESIRELRTIYESFYPGLLTGPGLIAESTPVIAPQGDGLTLLFSGGLDSTYSLFKSRPRHPRLLMVGGFDMNMDHPSDEGIWQKWKQVYGEFAEREEFTINFIRTNSRAILNEIAVDVDHGDRTSLKFWDALRHAPLLIGLAAPLSMGRFDELMISASRTPRRPPGPRFPYSSTPPSDESIAWAGLNVEHYGQVHRHEKVRALRELLKAGRIHFKSCWQLLEEFNCSSCHKCLRLIAMLLAEGVDPNTCGFDVDDLTLGRIWQKSSSWDWSRRRHHWSAWLDDLPAEIPDHHRIREFITWIQVFRQVARW